MSEQSRSARELAGERVRMHFADGHEVVALLLSATTDTAGAEHLVYDEVEWSSDADTYGGGRGTCYYADGKTLVSIERAEPKHA